MKIETVSNAAPDRPATADEIRSAISLLRADTVDSSFEIVCEIPADLGGYVRFTEEDLEAVMAHEADPEWADYLEYWSHISM